MLKGHRREVGASVVGGTKASLAKVTEARYRIKAEWEIRNGAIL